MEIMDETDLTTDQVATFVVSRSTISAPSTACFSDSSPHRAGTLLWRRGSPRPFSDRRARQFGRFVFLSLQEKRRDLRAWEPPEKIRCSSSALE